MTWKTYVGWVVVVAALAAPFAFDGPRAEGQIRRRTLSSGTTTTQTSIRPVLQSTRNATQPNQTYFFNGSILEIRGQSLGTQSGQLVRFVKTSGAGWSTPMFLRDILSWTPTLIRLRVPPETYFRITPEERLNAVRTSQALSISGRIELHNLQAPLSNSLPISIVYLTASDADRDGHRAIDRGGDDCDDNDATRVPGGTEVCDAAGKDEDCDYMTVGDTDLDGDGSISCGCFNRDPSGRVITARHCDCNDNVRNIHPLVPDVCGNRVDDDCDGTIDELCSR